jgi:TBC1 domain family protein 5
MHELVAVIYLVVIKDAIEEDSDELCKQLFDIKFVEHDTASLFIKLMNYTKQYYENTQTREIKSSPILILCNKLHSQYLKVLDPQLHSHFGIKIHNIQINYRLNRSFMDYVGLDFFLLVNSSLRKF